MAVYISDRGKLFCGKLEPSVPTQRYW